MSKHGRLVLSGRGRGSRSEGRLAASSILATRMGSTKKWSLRMLTRIYNDILQEPGLHYRVGIAMCTLAGMGLSLGLLLRLSGNLLSNFGVRVDMLSGLPWPFHQ